jgi:excisionase family DNA binding protein
MEGFWSDIAAAVSATRSMGLCKDMQELTLVTSKEVSKSIGCSMRHLATLCDRRLIPYYKLGKLKRFDLAAVKRALAKLEVKEAP